MRTECFVLECLIKKWLNNNEFIKENKTTVLLESLNKLDKSISLNFRHLDEAFKFIEFPICIICEKRRRNYIIKLKKRRSMH